MGQEPEEKPGCNAKAKSSSLSLFECAPGNEQVREKETVGAGRKATPPKGKAITVVASIVCPCGGVHAANMSFIEERNKQVFPRYSKCYN